MYDQPRLEMPAFESSFDWRFSFWVIAFRIVGAHHNIWSGNFSPTVNIPLSAQILTSPEKPPAYPVGRDHLTTL